MRIGILIGEFSNCSNWQLRIIQTILEDTSFELTAVIQETKFQSLKNDNKAEGLLSKLGLARLALSIQALLERKIFFKDVYSVDKESILQKLRSHKNLETVEQIQEQELDVLINLGFRHVPKELINAVKCGIWDFSLVDLAAKNYGPCGFNEIVQKKPSIGFTIFQKTSDKQVKIIDQAYFNRGWSMIETETIANEGGVSLLLKNLKRLQGGHAFTGLSQSLLTYEHPRIFQIFKYLVSFYSHLSHKIWQRIAGKLWGQRNECWTVFIGEGRFLESSISAIKPLEMPKDEFWADPFLFRHQKTDYVFFENFSYKTGRGKVSCGKVSGQKLNDVIDVLDFDYHLSFPYIFEEDGNVFLMPETSENKRLEIYLAVDFPTKWELYSTAFEGEMVADAFFYDDEQNQKWLFVNKQASVTAPMNSELYIYKVDSLKLENLQPHTQNPVIIDATVARNGGAIFCENNKLYRPSQRNVDGVYGRALNINEIQKFTIDHYEEKTVKICEPDFDKKLIAMHHLHQIENLFVFDACYKKK